MPGRLTRIGALVVLTLPLLGAMALASVDASYPSLLAAGIAQYRAGDYVASFDLLSEFLSKHDDGPWTLRAQNHRAAAAARLLSQE